MIELARSDSRDFADILVAAITRRCQHDDAAPLDFEPVGDIAELDAMRAVFGDEVPSFSSSKSLCGHSLGAAGVQEAVHCLLMLEQGFVAGSANISELDPKAEGLPVLRSSEDRPDLTTIMSNNFGFGGTNACLVLRQPGS